MTNWISRLEKTLTHSQFVDPPEEDDSDDDQIIETEEELRKSKVTFHYLENVCILILTHCIDRWLQWLCVFVYARVSMCG